MQKLGGKHSGGMVMRGPDAARGARTCPWPPPLFFLCACVFLLPPLRGYPFCEFSQSREFPKTNPAHLTCPQGPPRRKPRLRIATSALPISLSRGLTKRNREMSPDCRPLIAMPLAPAAGAPQPSSAAGDSLHFRPSLARAPGKSDGPHSRLRASTVPQGRPFSAEAAGKRQPRGQLHCTFIKKFYINI